MGDVVSLSRPCEYFVARASKHRHAGRYDEAMALLAKAKEQFGCTEEIELEMACTYDGMDCDEEAVRSYLRVVRCEGRNKGRALFQLALSCVRRGDMSRAQSYNQLFHAEHDQHGVPKEVSALLDAQLRGNIRKKRMLSRTARARGLEGRAIEKLQAGKYIAAKRAAEHAIRLAPAAQGYTLLACCYLLSGQPQRAAAAAQQALEMKPGRIQTRCVLIDALYACAEKKKAREALFLTAVRAKKEEDLLLASIESAKYGEDHLTLRLTCEVLRRNPFQTRAMILRGCTLMNMGRMREARGLFGRLCGLFPENTVFESYYRIARDGKPLRERLDLGLDVTHEESLRRTSQIMKYLLEARGSALPEKENQRDICRLCSWAIESPKASAQVKMAALVLLRGMNTVQARGILMDCLTDAQMDDQFKLVVLKMLTPDVGFDTYWMDFRGKLVRVAAGNEARQEAFSTETEEKDDELH